MKAVSNIISFLSMLFMLWFPLQLLAQEPEYKKWDNHDVKGVYTLIPQHYYKIFFLST